MVEMNSFNYPVSMSQFHDIHEQSDEICDQIACTHYFYHINFCKAARLNDIAIDKRTKCVIKKNSIIRCYPKLTNKI